jgi:hypothetical protein
MKAAITGKWKIVEMDQWDLEFIDMTEPGHITFKTGGAGQLHFGCVDAALDWRQDPGSDRVDFSFQGFDEGDEVNGRGWVKVEGKMMVGRIVFHLGEESGFRAQKSR